MTRLFGLHLSGFRLAHVGDDRLLTEVAGEEEGLSCRGPLLEIQAVVGSTLHTEGAIAARELVETSLRLLQLQQLLLQQLIPSKQKKQKVHETG